MAAPGTQVITSAIPPTFSSPSPEVDTGACFAVGTSDKGVQGAPTKVLSLSDFVSQYGDRQSYSYLYDAINCFFREGGQVAYVSRVVGPGAAEATATLVDVGDDNTLTVTARGAGDSYDDYSVAVSSGLVTISDADNVVIETFASSDKDDILAHTFRYVTFADADPTKGDPDTQTVALAGGDDDLGNVGDAEYAAAVNAFSRDLGPGQLIIPGNTSATVHDGAITHCKKNDRVALLDVPKGSDAAGAVAANHARDNDADAAYVAYFAPWLVIPGDGAGVARTVPPSGAQAGIEARRDKVDSVNVPAAGRTYPHAFTSSLETDFDDTDRDTLNTGGVNAFKNIRGEIRTYGYRSAVDPAVDASFVQFNNVRLRMAISAHAEVIGGDFEFDQIDGLGHKTGEFGAAIAGMLMDFYLDQSLFGDTPAHAFAVDVGPSVNTFETLEAGELHAVAQVRMSPFAERVIIEFVKTPLDRAIGG